MKKQPHLDEIKNAYRALTGNAVDERTQKSKGGKAYSIPIVIRDHAETLRIALLNGKLPPFEKDELDSMDTITWDSIRIILNRAFVYLKV